MPAAEPTSPAPFAAEVSGLRHVYGKTVALDGFSLAVPAGRLCGLIGPDGVGKSTLLSLIAGVREIQTGEVRALDGDMRDPIHRSVSHRRIAYMPQGLGRNLYPTLSVFENLDFFGRLFGQGKAEREARIAELLKATGLDPFPDRPAGKLSGGMKQKLALCCALIHDPDLLILDEPTTGVDPLSRLQFWSLIARMRARQPGMSVIVATAYMEEADRFDWLAAMNAGRVIGTGTPGEIKARAGQATLEAAFIGLLPQELRASHQPVVVPPRVDDDGVPSIEARGLTRRFKDFTAVDHVSFSVGRGEIFGFIGSNGCGKTTTMKMMTGLLPASEGEALLFGKPLDARDMEVRRRVGYMSQSFSLYSELTVLQNLELHARLFRLPPDHAGERIAEVMQHFELDKIADERPEALPLGIKQRLQLAVAVLHRPEVLILDEPTSGVDPIARDVFWRYLIELSRKEGVTIFLSTHFMNEAARCDRISLMHAGRVLAVGTPAELVKASGETTLEGAFISYLEAASEEAGQREEEDASAGTVYPEPPPRRHRYDPLRFWAYARRETMELIRDPIRLAFALLGPIILMIAFGYGISFDVENLPYAVYDQDQSRESRELLESFSGSRYFSEHTPITSASALDQRLKRGELKLAVEVPPEFGRDLLRGRQPEVAVWLDGAMPFRSDTARGYIEGLALTYMADEIQRRTGRPANVTAADVETRFRYNQAFKSVYAIVPGVIMLMLVLIPAMMTAVAVVREKETGSIANFRSTPVTKVEFLLGKQAPYFLTACVSFVTLLLLAVLVFGLSIKGSFLVLVAGSLLYILATTGFGLLVSSFTNTQIAALFATVILSLIPSVNFSGLLVPVSSLSTAGRIFGLAFPAAWFQQISIGVFTKGLGIAELWPALLMLAFFFVLFTGLAAVALRKREA
ncbi:MAG: ribosome-associated ATPase/putative transporter RbbA [Parvibaculum sp.]|uniref:ribosome-associated ATPase/putative transporter RbbA n=1 Tax=Parvibaculum sp. TaxID=2024848 RepID=UPI00283B5C52|nr:ribosome-associated ATPase/putative transporter RbbA [Parvibaculum sp.]MDR3498213.1 ribosome-associated ATPase/putative transporter RbbA [Parvibaculum sp.]